MKRVRAVHLRRGNGVQCGAEDSWRSRHKPDLVLSCTRDPAAVTCRRCLRTYAGRVAAAAITSTGGVASCK